MRDNGENHGGVEWEVADVPNAPSIFISYSTQDEPAARTVRNLFEDRGHDALLLKLQQHMSEEFIMDLLRNELKARDWVVFVDSPHALQSNWVTYERAVAGIFHKPTHYVDAMCAGSGGTSEALQSCLRDQVNRISRKLRVFISYSLHDREIATWITDALDEVGYETWYDQGSMMAGGDILGQVKNAIDTTLEQGVMLVLVSAHSVRSHWVEEELSYGLHRAASLGGKVIPVLIPPKAELPPYVAHIQAVDMTQDFDHGITQLLRALQYR